jgi:mRNA interferase HicA
MKRKQFLVLLRKKGCILHREGGNHSVFINLNKKKASTVPRHNEINGNLVRKICKDLEIDNPF